MRNRLPAALTPLPRDRPAARRGPAAAALDERRRLKALSDVTRRLTLAVETSEILALIVNEAVHLLGAEAASLRLIEGDQLVLRAQTERAASMGFRPSLHVAESLSGLVVSQGQPVAVEDLAQDTRHDPGHKASALRQGFHGFLGMPLRAHDRIIGVLNVFTASRRTFTADEIALLAAFGDQASVAIEKDRLLRQASDRATQLRRLVRLNHVLFSSLNTHEVLNAIAAAAAELMDAALVSIWSADETAQTLELSAISEARLAQDYPRRTRRFGDGGVGWVATHRRALDVADVSSDRRLTDGAWFAERQLTSAYFAPVMFRDALLGVLSLFGHQPLRFADDARELLDSFVAQAAVALRNARLYEELREAHERLERRTRDLGLLARMSEMLQACVREQELYTVVGQFMGECFPDDHGAVCLTSASRNIVEPQAVWGSPTPIVDRTLIFRPEDCWALRRGRPYRVDEGATALHCAHVPSPAPRSSLCLPLMAQGESLGLFYLAAPAGTSARWTESKEALGLAVADQLGLAIANLKLRDTLRSQSIRDPLTGLFNRRYMEETLEREVSRAERSRTPLAVVMLDLDHFKRLNDTFGHEAGDMLLREVGHLVKHQVRQGDVACRYGGEELMVVMPEITCASAVERADELRTAVKRLQMAYRGQTIGNLSVSLGVAMFPDHGTTPADLIKSADTALYRAKSAGRDQVVLAG